jgi:hypothetical protein
MTFIARLCLSLLLLSALPALAEDEDYSNAHTIRAADFPANPPRFEQYPVRGIYSGPLARPDVRSLARSRMFRTMIRQGAKSGVNFAGHYSIVSWGCGMGCRGLAVVDAVSGKVHHPANLLAVDNDNIDFDELTKNDEELVRFRPDSRLLIVIGGINEEPARRGISYFVWENDRLKRIRFVPKPYE